jgi:hypothetical protein
MEVKNQQTKKGNNISNLKQSHKTHDGFIKRCEALCSGYRNNDDKIFRF